jgi:hypothetical protein
MSHRGDATGALSVFSEALRLSPGEPASRAALERLLGAGDARGSSGTGPATPR